MLWTTDTSTRDQKWGLKVAIYVPGWEKYRDMHNYLLKLMAEFSNCFIFLFFIWLTSFVFHIISQNHSLTT